MESLLKIVDMKFEFKTLEIRFHKAQHSIMIVKTVVKCKRGIRLQVKTILKKKIGIFGNLF